MGSLKSGKLFNAVNNMLFPPKKDQIINEQHKLLKLENEKKRLEIVKEKKLLGAR